MGGNQGVVGAANNFQGQIFLFPTEFGNLLFFGHQIFTSQNKKSFGFNAADNLFNITFKKVGQNSSKHPGIKIYFAYP